MSKGNEPVHPVSSAAEFQAHGLTKRQYFAGLAMQGILANPGRCVANFEGTTKEFAQIMGKVAFEFADGLLAELEKTNDQ